MSKATPETKDGAGPAIFRFEARLVQHPTTGKTGSSTLLDVPKVVSKKLPSRGITKVEGTINGHPFRAAVEPNASGGHWLQVNKAMLAGAGADAGDVVKLVILEPESEPTVPADLQAALNAAQKAKALWKDLTLIGRVDWIRWIESARSPETRARRIPWAIESLTSGKRHPCCFNIYEFMMRHIPTNVCSPKRLSSKTRGAKESNE